MTAVQRLFQLVPHDCEDEAELCEGGGRCACCGEEINPGPALTIVPAPRKRALSPETKAWLAQSSRKGA